MELSRRCEAGEIELVRLASWDRGMTTSSLLSCFGPARPPTNPGAPGRGEAREKVVRCVALGASVAPKGCCTAGVGCCVEVD